MLLPEGVEPATVLFRRPGAEVGAERAREAALELDPLPLLDRLRRLLVERRSDLRRAAPVGKRRYDDCARNVADADLDPLAGRDLARRLHALAADLDVAGKDELRRGAPRLREPRRPEPFIDSHSLHEFHFTLTGEQMFV